MTNVLQVNSRRFALKFGVLSADVADDGALSVSFELHAERCQVEMDGYLPVPRTFASQRTVLELDEAQCDDLVFYEHEHLRFRRAKVVLTPRPRGQFELRVRGEVGDRDRRLKISATAVTHLEQVSVGPSSRREAHAVLARSGLPGQYVWTKMPNGLWTFYSPRRARSAAAFARLSPKVRRLARARAFQAAGLRAEVKRRWASDLRALLPADAERIDDLLTI